MAVAAEQARSQVKQVVVPVDHLQQVVQQVQVVLVVPGVLQVDQVALQEPATDLPLQVDLTAVVQQARPSSAIQTLHGLTQAPD